MRCYLFSYALIIFASSDTSFKRTYFFALLNSQHSEEDDFDYLFIKPSILKLFQVTIRTWNINDKWWTRKVEVNARNWGKEISKTSRTSWTKSSTSLDIFNYLFVAVAVAQWKYFEFSNEEKFQLFASINSRCKGIGLGLLGIHLSILNEILLILFNFFPSK